MKDLFRGAADLARGYRFLTSHPRLWIWVMAPALVTLLVFCAALWGALSLSDPLVAWAVGHVPSWAAGWLGGLLHLIVVAAFAGVSFFLFVTVAGAIAGPFCELVSEAVEERVTGAESPPFSPVAFVRGLVLSVSHALRRLVVYLFGLALLFLLGTLVPVVGTALAAAAGAYLTASSAAYDCFDTVFGRRLWRYHQKRAFLRRHRARTLGLGASVGLLMLIPVVNLLALGIGSAGATLATLDLEGQTRIR